MTFPNPVAGPIHPVSWVRPAGNREFQVTSPFGPRILFVGGVKKASVHRGLDIGNARAGANVMAQASGTVVEHRPNLDGVVTIQSGVWRLVYAHMTSTTVKIGQRVKIGQVIGQVGKVGTVAAHLHFENLELVNGKYQPRDPWKLLAQNGELPDTGTGDNVNLKGGNPRPITNRTTTMKLGGMMVADPTVQPFKTLHPFPVGMAFSPSWQVTGIPQLGTVEWYGGWVFTTPPQFGYLSVALCHPLKPIE